MGYARIAGPTTYHFIQELFDDERGGELLLKLANKDPAPKWDDPR
jgi:hypothetical protein